ncbi:MAG TPA: DUF2652 domain-containing protein [Anaerolineales bacterium]|jgi:hypothetical protein|nr:DUF2652 domain-containing protein [Anaerolineales bacterium]HQX16108.1 DUF2652 domain-containing protein [Anaerolineales bacterium]
MSTTTQHGYLVIADISGYTSFLAGTELEHSQEILADLLTTICEKIETVLTLHKLEGDAVFAYIPESKITRGETILELMESTYVTFRDKQLSMKRATTCTCNACRNIPALDLKFIAHHGDYVIQQVRDIREMVGTDVNLVHRLLKNHVAESTGWRAYMLITERCLDHLNLNLENVHEQIEEYEHLGEVKTYNIDLHQRYKELTDERRILIEEKDADIIFRMDFPTPPAVTWEWIQDPIKRNEWMQGHVKWSVGDRPRGRAGRGASNHCAHGKNVSTEVTLDWRPFEYSTIDSFENGRKRFSETFRFEPLPNGCTRVHDIMQLHMPLPKFLRQTVAHLILVYQAKYDQLLKKAAQLAGEEYEKNS